MVKWSSIRNGEKFFSCGVPIERRTRAPAPSDCSMARKALRIARVTVMFAGFGVPYIEIGGNSGRPLNVVVFSDDMLLKDSRLVRIVSLFVNAIVRIAIIVEIVKRRNFIETVECTL